MATVRPSKTEEELREYYERELGLTPGNARMMAALYLGKGQGDIVGDAPLASARAVEWAEQRKRYGPYQAGEDSE